MGLAPDSALQVLEHGEDPSVQLGLRTKTELVEERGQSPAIPRFDRPWAIRASTSRSRGVRSPSFPATRGRATRCCERITTPMSGSRLLEHRHDARANQRLVLADHDA